MYHLLAPLEQARIPIASKLRSLLRNGIALLTCCSPLLHATAQENYGPILQPRVDEAIELRNLEIAKHFATELYLKDHIEMMHQQAIPIKEKDSYKVVFYMLAERPVVNFTVTFDSIISATSGRASSVVRNFTPAEYRIYRMYDQALARLRSDTHLISTLDVYKMLLPYVSKTKTGIYVVTRCKSPDYIVFGNDLFMAFHNDGAYSHTEYFHKDAERMQFSKWGSNRVPVHHHDQEKEGGFTVTDFLTVLINEGATEWDGIKLDEKSHVYEFTFSTKTILRWKK